MESINKEKLVEKLTNIADGFRTSRSLTETLSLDDMATLAAVPITSGDNKFTQFVEGTLTEITAEDLEGITKIFDYAFYRQNNLVSVELPNTITEINEDAFAFTSKLSNIIFPNSLTAIGSYAFSNATALVNVSLPNSITNMGFGIFNNCSNLETITLPNALTKIPNSTFSNCYKLRDLTLPDTITYIGSGAFSNCSALINLTIPASVTEISSSNTLNIGTNTNKATFIFLPTTPPYISTTSFSVIKINKIIVPVGCGEAYKTATNWANLADYIEEASV